ncbi:hypothetical protein [Paraburkholderia acidisoli]|uniref:Uncharacterized protein n=1 Tax=Paraburkholderia acidisoli TaxID=2571748 RepID=A0A7Z2GHW0_9BURK|nr:hypothetical protein [Paraburkholderia acidisoli]QGZ62118.1 hypothetical protein FAZ98_10465 [Paraburkholderia acidisoli]
MTGQPHDTDENPCQSFFEANEENKEKVKALQKHPRLSEFENLTASRLSPGVVAGGEDLLRQVFNPLHIELDTGDLKPSAFDDASSMGLSVDREAHRAAKATVTEGLARAEAANAREGSTPRKLHGVARLRACDVRELKTEGARCFGVYDTAIESNIAHADVCQLIAGKLPGRSARSKLVELAQNKVILYAPEEGSGAA